jgi:hypothetical protein
MTTVSVEQDQLDRWATFADRVRKQEPGIRRNIARGEREFAYAKLVDLGVDAGRTVNDLQAAGAVLLDDSRPPTPAHLLDTPANRRLATALREAYAAAQEVDKERGQFNPAEPEDGPVSLPVVEILAKVETEVYGPLGTGDGPG